jgi:hypothetical protein
MASLSTELITTIEAFKGLRDPWNELVAGMEHAEIFYLWEWNFHYFRCFRPAALPLIAIVRDSSGSMVGIAPFCVRDSTRLGCRARVVETIVIEIADYRNIFVRNDAHRLQVVRAVFDCLREHAGAWDVIDIGQLCSRDPTTVHVINVARGYADWTVRSQMLTPVAVRKLKSGHCVENTGQTRQIRNRRKALVQRGFLLRIGCSDFAAYWPDFTELHRQTWPSSPFHLPHGRRFFDELIDSTGMRGKFEFSVAEFNGRPVAMHFGFVDARKVYYYMPVMDRAFRKDRIGAVLLMAMVDHYSATHEVFDFLRGLEEYKNWYTDTLEMNMRVVAYRSASFKAFVYSLQETLRRLAVDLGLPKAAERAARRLFAKSNESA